MPKPKCDPALTPGLLFRQAGIFANFVAGKSLSRILAELNDEGIPTNTGTGRWHKPTVWNMLRSRAYFGEAVMMRTTYDTEGNRVLRPVDEMAALPVGTIPPLTDRLTFGRAQARLEWNKSELVRPTDSTDALLPGGFVSCGSCRRRMTVKRTISGNRLAGPLHQEAAYMDRSTQRTTEQDGTTPEESKLRFLHPT